MTTGYPPHRTIPSIPIPSSIALQYLTAYLDLTTTNPSYLPDAKLEASGPVASAVGTSITIHNLERLQAGLRGEYLAPVLEFNEEGREEGINVASGFDDGTKETGEGNAGKDWQDLEDFQREQEEIKGGVVSESTLKSRKREHEVEEELEKSVKKPTDTKARKVEKKERNKQAKREKAELQAKKAAERRERAISISE
ncbi:hypothetical protein BJ875DRAFT_364948 [Amylocarpus encephaloides]|uniref:Uncharacterized protein n=1 Tax=Amylocarpus encephaloides TaxID=45428 RepID=A0A9P7YU39_9HELO|nr:hypothetical protein BJ875DRAFT_364948 [Amylocarpus encephaloides]